LNNKSDIFANLSVKEYEKGLPVFVISVIHGAAQDLPDPLDYFKRKAPEIPVKVRLGIHGPIDPIVISNFRWKC